MKTTRTKKTQTLTLSDRLFAAVTTEFRSVREVSAEIGADYASVLAEFYVDGWDERYKLNYYKANPLDYPILQVARVS